MTFLSLKFCNSSLGKIGRRVSAKILVCVIANVSCFDFEVEISQEKKKSKDFRHRLRNQLCTLLNILWQSWSSLPSTDSGKTEVV